MSASTTECRLFGEFIEQVVVDNDVWKLCDGCEKIDREAKTVVVKWEDDRLKKHL